MRSAAIVELTHCNVNPFVLDPLGGSLLNRIMGYRTLPKTQLPLPILTMTWMVNLEKSSVTDTASDLEKFSLDTADDFLNSPWSQIVSDSDPRNSDSDGNGLSDGSEAELATPRSS